MGFNHSSCAHCGHNSCNGGKGVQSPKMLWLHVCVQNKAARMLHLRWWSKQCAKQGCKNGISFTCEIVGDCGAHFQHCPFLSTSLFSLIFVSLTNTSCSWLQRVWEILEEFFDDKSTPWGPKQDTGRSYHKHYSRREGQGTRTGDERMALRPYRNIAAWFNYP